MQQYACGDVVPGCEARWVSDSADELLAEAVRHAVEDHGLSEVPTELLDRMRVRIVHLA